MLFVEAYKYYGSYLQDILRRREGAQSGSGRPGGEIEQFLMKALIKKCSKTVLGQQGLKMALGDQGGETEQFSIKALIKKCSKTVLGDQGPHDGDEGPHHGRKKVMIGCSAYRFGYVAARPKKIIKKIALGLL